MQVGSNPKWLMSLKEEEIWLELYIEGRQYEDMGEDQVQAKEHLKLSDIGWEETHFFSLSLEGINPVKYLDFRIQASITVR